MGTVLNGMLIVSPQSAITKSDFYSEVLLEILNRTPKLF